MKLKKKIKVMSLLLAILTVLSTSQFTPLVINATDEQSKTIEYSNGTEEMMDDKSETESSSYENFEDYAELVEEEIIPPLPNTLDSNIADLFDPNDNTAGILGIEDPNQSLYEPVAGAASIEDGVYALENVGNPGLWMDTQWQRSDPGYHIQQYAQSTCPAQSFYKASLFKISKIEGTNRYVIRLMLNNRLSFGFSGTDVITKEIPVKDSDVNITDTFTISLDSSSGYVIRPYNSTYVVAANNTTASGSGGAPNSYLAKKTAAAAGNQGIWKLYRYIGEDKYGTSLTNTTAFSDGLSSSDGSVVIGIKTWSTVIGANTPKLSADSTYNSVVSCVWNQTTYTMTVTARAAGDFKIRASVLNDDGTTYKAVLRSYVVAPELYDKITFIENASTGRFVDVEGPSKNSGAIIQQWQFNGKPQSKWTFEATSDGYFRIVSKYSGLYLGVDSSATTSVKQYDTESNYTQWQLIETASGNYKFVCKATKSSGYVLSSASATSGNGSDLVMASYINDSDYKDEWIVHTHSGFENFDMDIGDQRKADLRGVIDIYPSTFTDFTYTVMVGTDIVSVDNSTGTFTALKSGTARIRAIHKSTSEEFQFRIKVNKNAIIIVPGVMGSILVAGENNSFYSPGTVLWGYELLDEIDNNNLSVFDVANRISLLACNSNGSSPGDIVAFNNNYGAGDQYKTIFESLKNEFEPSYEICFFAYDWRLSNEISGEMLNDFIESSQFDNVVLVCHSMGGLVASSYLSIGQEQRNKVETMISLGTPYLGTPTMPCLWGSENIDLLNLDISESFPSWVNNIFDLATNTGDPIDIIIGNFESLYEMFPTEKFFDSAYGNEKYLVTSFIGIAPQLSSTYADTRDTLINYLPKYQSSLAMNAEDFHNSLFVNGEHVTSLINTYYIASSINNTNENTIESISWNGIKWSVESRTPDGDKMVPVFSACLADKYPSKTFFAQNVEHGNLILNSGIISFVKRLISNNSSLDNINGIYANYTN